MASGTLKLIARLLLGLVALFMLANGLMLMFYPAAALPGMAVTADGAEGLSNIRALWGGAVTAIGLSVAIAAYTLDIRNARPAVLFTFALVVSRLVGMAADGMFDRAVLFTIVPIAVFAVLLVAHKLLDKAHASEAATA